jgi:hypothetical protein
MAVAGSPGGISDEAVAECSLTGGTEMSGPTVTDPFFRGRCQEKLGEIRGAIREIETITGPVRQALTLADRRLAVLRQVEAEYVAALAESEPSPEASTN